MQKDPFLKLSPTERTFFFVKATEGTTVMHDVEQVTYEQTKRVLGGRRLLSSTTTNANLSCSIPKRSPK